MKKLDKLLKGHKYILFIDFEGTQFSHEMIAFGAVLCKIKKDGQVVASKKPYKEYVKAKNKIGKFVTDLTGINEKTLQEKGISFSQALLRIKKYCGLAFKKATFCTFGSHDIRILSQSFIYNIDADKEITSQIQKNHLDFANFMSEFIRDEKGNPLSLIHSLELFNIKPSGTSHDPIYDAIDLMNVYNAFVSNKKIISEQYMLALTKTNHFPEPVKVIVNKIISGENVTIEILENEIDKYIG